MIFFNLVLPVSMVAFASCNCMMSHCQAIVNILIYCLHAFVWLVAQNLFSVLLHVNYCVSEFDIQSSTVLPLIFFSPTILLCISVCCNFLCCPILLLNAVESCRLLVAATSCQICLEISARSFLFEKLQQAIFLFSDLFCLCLLLGETEQHFFQQ